MNAPWSAPTADAVARLELCDKAGMERVERFVRGHPHGQIFQLPAWLRAVERGCGQRGHYLSVEGGQGEVVAVLPVVAMKSVLFGKALVSSAFAVGGGILSDDEREAHVLGDACVAGARAGAFHSAELRGGSDPGPGWSADRGAHAGFARPLAADEDAELKAIPRKQRAEVRKALGFDLSYRTGSSARDLAEHYRVYAESVRNLGTPVFPRRLFEAMLEEFGDDADILTVSRQGKPLASVLSFYWAGAVMPYWGGGTAEARTWRANDAMYFALMNHARRRGCTRFDFGRSKVDSGAHAFKKNWGFEPQPLEYWRKSIDGARVSSISPDDPRYARRIALWKKLPLPVANRLGPLISRGLG